MPELFTDNTLLVLPSAVIPVPPDWIGNGLFKIKLLPTEILPATYSDSPIPTPPLTISAPVVVEVETDVLLKVLIPENI